MKTTAPYHSLNPTWFFLECEDPKIAAFVYLIKALDVSQSSFRKTYLFVDIL